MSRGAFTGICRSVVPRLRLPIGEVAIAHARRGISRQLERPGNDYLPYPASILLVQGEVTARPRAHHIRISAELGYADHAHLACEFRRLLGLVPTLYRRDIVEIRERTCGRDVPEVRNVCL